MKLNDLERIQEAIEILSSVLGIEREDLIDKLKGILSEQEILEIKGFIL